MGVGVEKDQMVKGYADVSSIKWIPTAWYDTVAIPGAYIY